ncbi:MAG: Ldh family oxidoreductase [Caldilineaceae bacterium]|nr:Ldh family oxidoreductase [Caldilineaceae bacterium]
MSDDSITMAMTVAEIHNISKACLIVNGCDEANANAIATTVSMAERDGATSHGLFRIPGYVQSMRSGKVNGKANPKVHIITPAVIRVDGDGGYTPLALHKGIPLLAKAAKAIGIASMTIINTYHFAALWPETEAIADYDLAGLACTAYKPVVVPAGAKEALFGTNPLSFSWPRPGKTPMVYDMATAAKSLGDLYIAVRDGQTVPLGTGLDADGNPTTDPRKITDGGVILPFGGYKGSAICMMVELLSAGVVGENFSFEAAMTDNSDGGPARGGEFLIAISPELIAGAGWQTHSEKFFDRLTRIEGAYLPGQRRHMNRLSDAPRQVNAALVETIKELSQG